MTDSQKAKTLLTGKLITKEALRVILATPKPLNYRTLMRKINDDDFTDLERENLDKIYKKLTDD